MVKRCLIVKFMTVSANKGYPMILPPDNYAMKIQHKYGELGYFIAKIQP
jgi:hypothetical protein